VDKVSFTDSFLTTDVGDLLYFTDSGGGFDGVFGLHRLRTNSNDDKYKRRGKQGRLGLILLIVLTLHNLPEGLAVSAAVQAQHQTHGEQGAHHRGGLGIVVTFAIALHNVFEGFILAVPLYAATNSRRYAVSMAFLSGLPVFWQQN
jgi:ZIP family zinc transporter